MALPTEIVSVFNLKNKCLEKNDFTDWGNLVFLLKKNILRYKSQLNEADWREIEKTLKIHQEKLNKKHRFLKNYRDLLLR